VDLSSRLNKGLNELTTYFLKTESLIYICFSKKIFGGKVVKMKVFI